MMQRDELQIKLAELHSDSYAWAVRCCAGDNLVAEEVLQESYLKVLRKIRGFKAQASFKTWFFAIIRYTAIDYIKAKAKRKTLRIEDQVGDLSMLQPTTDSALDNRQLQLIFRQALAQLSPQQKQTLHLVFYQNCSIQEAADIMGIQVGTARTHYERGKNRLRQLLDKEGILKQMI